MALFTDIYTIEIGWDGNMKQWNNEYIIELNNINERLHEGGGKHRLQKLHEQGKLTARERVGLLLGDNYVEIGKLSKSRTSFPEIDREHYWGDGIIAAAGKLEGVMICVVAQDSTVYGGSGGEVHINKMCEALEHAIRLRCPIVFLCDSGGARIEEGIHSLAAYSRLFRLNTLASGYIPQIAAIMGNCAGGSSYSPALCDFVLMIGGQSQFFITGPKVIKALTGEDVTMEELGGAEIHSRYSGQAHLVCKDDVDCINKIKTIIRYLAVPIVEGKRREVDYNKLGSDIMRIVPDNPRKPYDVRKVLKCFLDKDSFFELLPNYATNIIIGFARLEGRTIGIVANQPNVLGGAIDCDASDKCARFVRTCDCYEIPILTIVDVPGFYPGLEEERKGILRHGSKILFAYSEANVPKVSLIVRKAYGGAYCAMNSKSLGADYVIAWPICEIAVMGADGAVDVLFHKEIELSEDPNRTREERILQYEREFLTPYYAASQGYVDDIIAPEDTRNRLIELFDALESKYECFRRIDKKHNNIPL